MIERRQFFLLLFFFAYTSLELSNMKELVGVKAQIDDVLEKVPRKRLPMEEPDLYKDFNSVIGEETSPLGATVFDIPTLYAYINDA